MGNHNSFNLNHKEQMHSARINSLNKDPTLGMLPMEKLGKLLIQKSLEEDSINGIGCGVFKRYLFPQYPEMARKLFAFLVTSSGGPASSHVISYSNFKIQTERLLSVLADDRQVLMYVTMYADGKEEIDQEQFRDLLIAVYKLAMDHYPEGPQSCRYIFKTIQAVVDSAFHKKLTLKVGYLTNWILQHCPRLIVLLHRYIVHILSTGYRSVIEKCPYSKPNDLELTTPVLEKENEFKAEKNPLLPLSQVWILSTTLPALYTQPILHSKPTPNCFNTQNFLSKFLDFSCPSHWTLLYNSNQHGIGSNRFLHHVLSYRGPTLTFLRGDDGVLFCMGGTSEWRESHQYWGGDDTIILQLLPFYKVINRGPKSMYLNTSIRGYPKGIRAGNDPRKPSIQVDDSFQHIIHCGIPYKLESIEVWGCGSPKNREVQLDIKNWQIKEAEKNRTLKMTSKEWLDHPDRYLLELAGRQTYSTT